MHPLFRHWRYLLLYLATWIALGVLIGFLAPGAGRVSRLGMFASVIFVPFIGLICLLPYYICRSVPLRTAAWKSLVQNHLLATVFAAAGVTFTSRVMGAVMASAANRPQFASVVSQAAPILTVVVALTWLLSTAIHYVFLEIESSRRAESLAREAELKALKAQINPHFLFNSLNSISALTSIDPARAREMCIGLSDFLRSSLRLGERDTVPFSEEMALTNMYLEVEQARFGDRLRVARHIDPTCNTCEIPALLIQPLVENAVKHGIAMMAEGGIITVTGRVIHDSLLFQVTNPFDPEAPKQARNGIGLRNVRARLEARYGTAGKMQIHATENSYQVTLTLPVKTL